ncbi:hypothetical protein OBBRIDRAFT_817467 [Obba rivulosa]|uniref:RRN7-type domain-containing protein n=1 Tax=Obba rivulosa TaxID=1052685 RepID=A0A8E2DR41_9APHY|nr:hypothetical protein OBBRIDRAFT_817467 [Obba rivulosa]
MPPRRRCPVCGSKQWHKEPSSGLITCSEGHVLQNYRNETREVTELGPHALRKRALKSGRKRKEKQSKANPRLYHGERARFHYFQCLQLILRMQVTYLAEAWGLPPEFETVCRDLWALNLSLLPSLPPVEPLHYMRDERTGGDGSSVHPASTGKNPSEDDTDDHRAAQGDDHATTAGQELSSSSSSSEDEEDDAIMADLMREASVVSTSSDEDVEDGPDVQQKPQAVKKKRAYRQYDAPDSTIAVLMLACWTLRLPVMYMDFVRLIETYELPYLDSIRLLPPELALHLTKHTKQALSPHHAPMPLQLHRLTARLAKLMYSQYGVCTPEMNAAPILWRAVRALCGTPTLYTMTKKLARVISLPLTLHRSLAPGLPHVKKGDPSWHKYDNAVPEVSLVASIIVVLKLVYGLDGKPRLPKEQEDPACAMPRFPDVMKAIEDLDTKIQEETALFSAKEEISVLDLDDNMLDQYIAFTEKALLSPAKDKSTGRSAVADFFPLEQGPSLSPESARVHSHVPAPMPPGLPALEMDRDDGDLRPGEQYTIYNTLDVLGVLPEDYGTVVRRAANWAGVDEDYIAGVVERFERRLVRWWDRRREEEDADDKE